MKRAVAETFLGMMILMFCGCATYQPRPVDPVALLAHWQMHRLDDPSLANTTVHAFTRQFSSMGGRVTPCATWGGRVLLRSLGVGSLS